MTFDTVCAYSLGKLGNNFLQISRQVSISGILFGE